MRRFVSVLEENSSNVNFVSAPSKIAMTCFTQNRELLLFSVLYFEALREAARVCRFRNQEFARVVLAKHQGVYGTARVAREQLYNRLNRSSSSGGRLDAKAKLRERMKEKTKDAVCVVSYPEVLDVTEASARELLEEEEAEAQHAAIVAMEASQLAEARKELKKAKKKAKKKAGKEAVVTAGEDGDGEPDEEEEGDGGKAEERVVEGTGKQSAKPASGPGGSSAGGPSSTPSGGNANGSAGGSQPAGPSEGASSSKAKTAPSAPPAPPPSLHQVNVVPLDAVLRLVFHNPKLRSRWISSDPRENGHCVSCGTTIPFRHDTRCAFPFAKCGATSDDALGLLKRGEVFLQDGVVRTGSESGSNTSSNSWWSPPVAAVVAPVVAPTPPPARVPTNHTAPSVPGANRVTGVSAAAAGTNQSAWQNNATTTGQPSRQQPQTKTEKTHRQKDWTAAPAPKPFAPAAEDEKANECLICMEVVDAQGTCFPLNTLAPPSRLRILVLTKGALPLPCLRNTRHDRLTLSLFHRTRQTSVPSSVPRPVFGDVAHALSSPVVRGQRPGFGDGAFSLPALQTVFERPVRRRDGAFETYWNARRTRYETA